MPLIRETAFAGLDFESAGERPDEAGIPVQVGIAEMSLLGSQPGSFFRSYLRTERPVTWAAQRVHGITDTDLAGAPTLLALWPEIKMRLSGRWIVAHGAGTERRYLRVFPAHGFGPWVDTLTLSRKILPGRDSYALSDLAAELSLVDEARSLLPDFRWHEALSDAVACLLLLQKLIELSGIGDHPVEALLQSDR